MKQKGFTLIELLVVMTITIILGTLTIARFDNYKQVQVLQTSTNEVATMLNEAKSRAQSQVKLSSCGASKTLSGYEVDISSTNETYKLISLCSGSLTTLETKTLPKNVIFKNTSSTSFFFPVLSGGVQAAGSVTISSSGKIKTITVNTLGGIRVQND